MLIHIFRFVVIPHSEIPALSVSCSNNNCSAQFYYLKGDKFSVILNDFVG